MACVRAARSHLPLQGRVGARFAHGAKFDRNRYLFFSSLSSVDFCELGAPKVGPVPELTPELGLAPVVAFGALKVGPTPGDGVAPGLFPGAL